MLKSLNNSPEKRTPAEPGRWAHRQRGAPVVSRHRGLVTIRQLPVPGSHSEAAEENCPLLVSCPSGHLLHGWRGGQEVPRLPAARWGKARAVHGATRWEPEGGGGPGRGRAQGGGFREGRRGSRRLASEQPTSVKTQKPAGCPATDEQWSLSGPSSKDAPCYEDCVPAGPLP